MPFLAREEGFDLCLKVLSFYKEQGCDGNILIALSGDVADKEKFRELLKSCDFSGRVYEHGESSGDLLGVHILYDKMYEAVKSVDTEFVTIISADDFTLPDAITHACQTLHDDASIAACSGRGFLYNPETRNVAIYPQMARMEMESSSRLSSYIRKPTALFYSTYRSSELVDVLRQTSLFLLGNSDLIRKNISFSEHIFSFFVIMRGRLYVRDELYFIRLQHSQQVGKQAPSVLASYIAGDVDAFIKAAQNSLGVSALDIRDSYKAYIYAKGAYNPKFSLMNIRLSLQNPARAFDLFWHSLCQRIKNDRPTWVLDDVHKRDQNSVGYQRVMRHLA